MGNRSSRPGPPDCKSGDSENLYHTMRFYPPTLVPVLSPAEAGSVIPPWATGLQIRRQRESTPQYEILPADTRPCTISR